MRILIAEDDLVSRRVLQATLVRWGHDVVVCCDGNEAWETLQNQAAPSLIILDWMMPGLDGIEVCRKVRKLDREPYSYILLLTARSQKEDIVIGMEAGADDYITKPFDVNELKVRLRAGERILNLQKELISAREILRDQATHDPLTGLWNHATIIDLLRQELNRAKRQKIPVGVIMADLDHFKRINDTYGHPAGDIVLRETAQRMSTAMRPYDAVGRYGGEEFLIIMPGCNEASMMNLAERLLVCVSKEEIDISEHTISITVSLGGVSCEETQQVEVSALIKTADIALYRAKDTGRNRVVLASLEEDMKNAVCQ